MKAVTTAALIGSVAKAAEVIMALGAKTDQVKQSKVRMVMETSSSNLKVSIGQQIIMLNRIAMDDAIETFSCWQRLTAEWTCIWSSLAFDGAKHTIKNSAYTITTEPSKYHFTDNKPFNDTAGFSLINYTKFWECDGLATNAGSSEAKGVETLAATAYLWQTAGNFLDLDMKVYESYVLYQFS